MTAVRDLIGPEEMRQMAAELRKDADWHREQWRDCNAQAAELENLLTAEERHVTVREPTRLQDRPKYEETVRDAAYELTQGGAVFCTADVVNAGVPYPTAMKWLKVWEGREMLESIHDGGKLWWSRTKTYAPPVNRPRRETPERLVVRREARRQTVEGIGVKRVGNKVLETAARKHGLTLVRRNHTIEFQDNQGNVVAHGSGEAKGLKRTNKQLRESGYDA